MNQATLLLRVIGEESMSSLPVVRLDSQVEETTKAPSVFLLPGIEGMATVFQTLANNLESHAICFQYRYDNPEDTIQEMAVALRKVNEQEGNLKGFFGIMFFLFLRKSIRT